MVGVALFRHEDPIHAQGDISKDGVTEIVDAVGVSGIVGIGVGQIGFQSCIPSRWIRQAHFDFESEGIGIVIIVGAWNGEGDGLDARQGGLKLHLPRGFVPIIHIGHVKQLERHDAVCPRCSTASSFYTFSHSVPIMDGMSGWKGAVRKIDLDAFFQLAEEATPFLLPGFGLIGPQHLPEIPLAKNRAPFYTA